MGVSRYPDEFKAEAVRLARTSGRSKRDIAQSLGISEQTIYAWMHADDVERRERTQESERLSDDERDELKRLRKENGVAA